MVKFDLGMLADAISVVGLVLIVFVFLYAPKNGVPDTEGYPTSANSTALSFPWALRRFNTARSVEHRIPLGQSGKPFSSTRPLTYEDYTVGWICALPIEMAAAKAMLDEVHPDLPANPYDDNTYILGTMRSHNAAIACLPTGVIGSTPAAMVATNMLSTFRSIRFGLLVGIGGGVPFQADIRLGDVVVAKPTKNHGGVVQYNYTKTIKECTLKETCTLNKPPRVLLTALSKLQASHLVNGNEIARSLSEMATKYPLMISILRPQNQDQLFRSEYHHIGTNHTCNACDTTQLQTRAHRKDNTTPRIHYGLMASGNQVVKDGSIRDHLARQSNIWCFEMEAAGLMDKFPCLVIRGISDYADSHKNDTWQGYAAATAAAYAKELLSVIPTHQVEDTPSVAQVYAS